jgi:hypothetical protein
MQLLPHGLDLPGLQLGGGGETTWQTFPTAMQVSPHGTPLVQCGAALAAVANDRAARAMIVLRMLCLPDFAKPKERELGAAPDRGSRIAIAQTTYDR